jgi:hypothetical protein
MASEIVPPGDSKYLSESGIGAASDLSPGYAAEQFEAISRTPAWAAAWSDLANVLGVNIVIRGAVGQCVHQLKLAGLTH